MHAPRSLLLVPSAFTLLEVILAIALSAVLLVLIGTVINLYLVEAEASRTLVEEAQLARNVLEMIAKDLRQSVIYQPQDTTSVAELAAQFKEFDSDQISAPTTGEAGGGDVTMEESTIASQGVLGELNEIVIDTHRLPRQDSWLARQATSVYEPMTPGMLWGDVKTVRYFVRPGERLAASDVAATRLGPPSSTVYGGLVRQEIDRTARVWAEEAGNREYLESGIQLVAPEVIAVTFRYFDGLDVYEAWDMREMQGLPRAVEIRIWVQWLEDGDAADANVYNATTLPPNAHEYRLVVALPLGGTETAPPGGSTEEEP